MSSIAQHLHHISQSLPNHVTLVAVSKTKPMADILEAYNAGQRIFGENKVQEMTEKYQALPQDIQWHMIGHLQSNKVKYMAPYVALVHGVDSLKLLAEIDRQAQKHARIIPVLLQVHIAEEESKFGFDAHEIREILDHNRLKDFSNIKLSGLMGMATFTNDQTQIKREFESLASLYAQYADTYEFDTLSMGMSGDYALAIACGSTMVRIGSSIFGNR